MAECRFCAHTDQEELDRKSGYTTLVTHDAEGNVVSIRTYKCNRKHGAHIFYRPPTDDSRRLVVPCCKFQFVDGNFHGTQETYFEGTGGIALRITYSEGRKATALEYFDPDGQRFKRVFYDQLGNPKEMVMYCPTTGNELYSSDLTVLDGPHIIQHMKHPHLDAGHRKPLFYI